MFTRPPYVGSLPCPHLSDPKPCCLTHSQALSPTETSQLEDAWWWSDEGLLSCSRQVVEVNASDARAWLMRAEVLSGMFGRAPWSMERRGPVRSSAQFLEASRAYTTAAKLTRKADWQARLLRYAEKAEDIADDPSLLRSTRHAIDAQAKLSWLS